MKAPKTDQNETVASSGLFPWDTPGVLSGQIFLRRYKLDKNRLEKEKYSDLPSAIYQVDTAFDQLETLKFLPNARDPHNANSDDLLNVTLEEAKSYFRSIYKAAIHTITVTARSNFYSKNHRNRNESGLLNRVFAALRILTIKEGLAGEVTFDGYQIVDELALRNNFLYHVIIMHIRELFERLIPESPVLSTSCRWQE